MLSAQNLIEEALALPFEQRAFIIESLVASMHSPNTEADYKWTEISRKRLDDLKSGKVKGIPGDEVFNKIWERFPK